jgi:hypothetical protein
MNDRKKMFFNTENPSIFNDILLGYSLRKLRNIWNNRVLTIRRSSDNAETSVFFDGDTITLNSKISTIVSNIPSTTSLSTWIGSDSAFVKDFYPQTPDGIENATDRIPQVTASSQPRFINAGVIETYSGKPSIYSDGTTYMIRSGALSALNYGNAFTLISVSANTLLGANGTVFSNHNLGFQEVLRHNNDRRTQKRNTWIYRIGGTYIFTDNLVQDNTSNQKLQSFTIDASGNMEAWKNGVSQSTNSLITGYYNNSLRLFSGENNSEILTGHIQEFLIYNTKLTTTLADVHTDINNYYTIY